MKYPDISVQLVNTDGNAMAIVSKVRHALHEHGVSKEEVDQFVEEAFSGDYDNLLQTCIKWVDVT